MIALLFAFAAGTYAVQAETFWREGRHRRSLGDIALSCACSIAAWSAL